MDVLTHLEFEYIIEVRLAALPFSARCLLSRCSAALGTGQDNETLRSGACVVLKDATGEPVNKDVKTSASYWDRPSGIHA